MTKILTKNIATLQSQVYKGNLQNVSMQQTDIVLFVIVQHILDYKANVLQFPALWEKKQQHLKRHPDVETLLVNTLPSV